MSDSEKVTPFEVITETYLTIEDLRVINKELTRRITTIPDQVLPATPRRKVRSILKLDRLGSTAKMPKRVYLGAIILRNELLGSIGKATDKHGLSRAFRKEYPNDTYSSNSRYFTKFAEFRRMYNRGTLYQKQIMPPLYAWYWTHLGYIRHATLTTQMLSFEFCKRQLIKEQFIDPRFFTPYEMSDYMNKDGWHVPSLEDVQRMEAEIQQPIYDSITFPPGWGKGHDPL